MAVKIQSQERLAFGDYELVCGTGELRHNGTLLKLQPQPAKVLTILASRSGEVVTRQELAEQVWGSDTYVDFEHGLNFAIRQIRSVLKDDAENPVYVETVPRRGYRFVAPIIGNGHQPQTKPVASKPKPGTWPLSVSALVLILAALGLAWYLRRPPSSVQNMAIVLGDFANHTGDAVFDGTLREGLSVQLEQSPYVRFISEEQVHEILRLMNRPKESALSPEISREVCQRANAAVSFAGSIDLVGSRYNLVLRGTECATGNVLASTQAEATDKSQVINALSRLASDIRRKLGEPLSSIRQYDVPLASVTTPSIEALRCYSEGQKSLSREFNYSESLSWFRKATELDPDFAMAYWAIGDVYAILGETHTAVDYTRKAFELRNAVSVREKALIEANYYYYVAGDVEAARYACAFLSKLYTFSPDTHNSLAVFAEAVGQYDVGLAEYLEASRLAPERSYLYRDLAYTYLVLDRFNEASAVVEKAHAAHLDDNLAAVLYSIAFYRGDPEEMARQVASTAGNPELEGLLLQMDADSAAYSGQLRKARMLSQRAADSSARNGRKETGALYDAVSSLHESMLGNSQAAQHQTKSNESKLSGRDVTYARALAFLYAGDVKHGQALTDEIGRRFPQDTVVRCNYLPTLHAKLALLKSDPQRAIDVLEHTGSCELGLPVYTYYNWPNLYPAYVRGEAYLAAHRGAEAVTEFRKVLAHRGLVLNEPIGALARLELARAHVMCKATPQASAEYEDFLVLWKEADADIPVLRQARVEYAKLRADIGAAGGVGPPRYQVSADLRNPPWAAEDSFSFQTVREWSVFVAPPGRQPAGGRSLVDR